METKKIIAVLLIIIVVITAGVLFYKYRDSVVQTKTNAVNNNTNKTFLIEDKKIIDNTNPFKINIVYPQIGGLDFFNKTVLDAVNKEIGDFKTNSLQNDEAVKKVDPAGYAKYPREYDLNITYTKGEIDENIASVVLNVYNFEGGAHGSNYFLPFNYNLKTKQEIKLADLFPGQSDYLQKISDFCIADLKKQMTVSGAIDMTDDSWITRGAGPAEENYSVFLINPSTSSGQATITFYFPQYQVAAGAAGNFEVTMLR
jgi:hypothetical protein